ncbi:MAG: hypothetical protein P8Y24_01650 [Gammaproteobacteria bacterium]|jgi:hypothetical protein
MRTASLHPLQANVFAVLLTALKITLPLLLLLYGIFHFSTFHWAMIGLVASGILAISFRVTRMNAASHIDATVKPNVIHADGGTFREVEQSKVQKQARPVVYDGGIVKHKVSDSKSRS